MSWTEFNFEENAFLSIREMQKRISFMFQKEEPMSDIFL